VVKGESGKLSRYSDRLLAGGRGSLPNRGKIFFSSPRCPYRLCGPQSPIKLVPGLFPPGKVARP
jgi:hypothetical protein